MKIEVEVYAEEIEKLLVAKLKEKGLDPATFKMKYNVAISKNNGCNEPGNIISIRYTLADD